MPGSKSRFVGNGHPSFERFDDHLPLYGKNGSLDPSTYEILVGFKIPKES